MLAAGFRDFISHQGSCLTSVVSDMLLLQAMTRPFEPGADRLASVAHKDSEVSGCPIIEGANAVLDCKVVSGARQQLRHNSSSDGSPCDFVTRVGGSAMQSDPADVMVHAYAVQQCAGTVENTYCSLFLHVGLPPLIAAAHC
jgi:hypothetical protein